MGRGIVLKCINCGQPCEEEQLNCTSCQRNLDNEQEEGSSLIDKELEVYVGRQYPYYQRKWELENKRIARWSWNGWAAIFNIGWLGYRKYYVPAALFMLLLVACDAFSYYMGFNVALPIINMVPLTFLLLIFILFGMGIFANGLYYQFAERRIYRIKAREIKDKSVENYLINDSGGTSKMGATIVTILAVASIFFSHFFFPTDRDVIQKVRTSSLYEYPFFSIGESFENYFQNSGWIYYRGTEGLELVEFQGYNTGTSRQKVKIQFVVDYKLGEVEPYSLMVNGESKTEEEFLKLMEEIFKVQNPFDIEDGLQVNAIQGSGWKEISARFFLCLLK
ncbi:DUF2628 domain-containing protein [Bacillus thuringiensis]|uniref:DUF2628 domain-containing protein n=1 Tax=Bacillus thuringiensis TaxID=1428 RepID=UPI0009FB8403|nr:DUF2628 domain-containing protein [Bacillus thuringiensis]PFB51095.1 DUF2628 domain-containing protein [Bacillus thuringiensis]PFE98380.1 DUF2628 domain-containing protein [Bacillus thuringiensis]PFV43383.1 DUF2628 domain-containing protein [Bacillus thuringiensis]PFV51154.1 DUF2628 domain-containing protein [Bacillus thuringiensis]